MIEQVVKRNGSVEPFNANKLNGWGEWAANNIGYVDWSYVVMTSVSTLPKKISTKQLQERLIKVCLDEGGWSYNKMAGRLYAQLIHKETYPKGFPALKGLHKKLYSLGLMRKLNYTDEEYSLLNDKLNHSLDYDAAYFELHQVRQKYSIKTKHKHYETQQYTLMRMSMALCDEFDKMYGWEIPSKDKLEHVCNFYSLFSQKILNAPTPNYVNLGTRLRGLASCCTYTTNDNWRSLAIGDHIAYTMTCMSAGIGSHIKTRSEGDPVRGGVIEHMGKLPYYRSLVGAIGANMQNGRGGAATVYFTAHDPEVSTLLELKNPMSTEDKKIRGVDYAFTTTKTFARAVARDEEVALFSYYDEPALYEAQYSDNDNFDKLYKAFLKSDKKKTFVRARDLIISSLSEAYETGRSYLFWSDEANRHNPYKDKIYSSNLCLEALFPTKGYNDMRELYDPSLDENKGEIGLCSLGAINVGRVKEDDALYAKAAYYALLMIDVCIHSAEYALPHLEATAKARMNAGVGMVGVAHLMAQNKLSYADPEGKNFLHTLAETHAWHLYNASLKLSKQLGVAPWMEKTKWVDGWTPLSTYNKNVDSVVTVDNKRDWQKLSEEIKANGGIRNSVCINYMPSESSSIASGTTNSVYPVRDLSLIKTDGKKITYWAAPQGEWLRSHYEIAWDVPTKDMIDVYAIFQKWTDQGISADLYRKVVGDDVITTDEMINDYLYMTKMGLKTRYYQNSKTSDGAEINSDESGCAGGSCTL